MLMSPTDALIIANPITTTYNVSGIILMRSIGLKDAQNTNNVQAIINTTAQPIENRNSFVVSKNGIIIGGNIKRDKTIKIPIIPSRIVQ